MGDCPGEAPIAATEIEYAHKVAPPMAGNRSKDVPGKAQVTRECHSSFFAEVESRVVARQIFSRRHVGCRVSHALFAS